jgi:ABC-2 type transport system permease protein
MSALLALIKKEFLAIWKDKKSRVIIIVPPMLQLLVFSFAATLEVKNISLAVYDRDNTPASRELIEGFRHSRSFSRVIPIQSHRQIREMIDNQRVLAALVIEQGFARDLQGSGAVVQILLDGRRSTAAQSAARYIETVIEAYRQKLLGGESQELLRMRNWYNPNLDNFWWIVPNLMGVLSMLIALLLTALSVARERELGTFDQLLVSPVSPTQIILGKTIPAALISLAEGTLILLVGIFVFGISIQGSLLILYLGLFAFLLSIIGIGLFVSTISMTQQQAILGAFVIMIPSILLSGFATPVENMPGWLIAISDIVSLKYFLVLIKGVFFKSIPFEAAWGFIWPLFLIALGTLGVSIRLFRSKLE